MTRAEDSLLDLAERLRAEDTVISPHVRPGDELRAAGIEPVLGQLAAAGPRAALEPAAYSLVVEAVREGYLLHYGEPRLLAGLDRDLALLAGDYLYALGLERLAGLADLEGVRELADLISLQAQLHAAAPPGEEPAVARALWLASVVALAAGAGEAHGAAKAALREERPEAGPELEKVAVDTASRSGLGGPLGEAADAIESAPGGSP